MCAIALFAFVRLVFQLVGNVLHMACGGFEALSVHPKPKLATKRKPCWQPFTRHKLYALLAAVIIQFLRSNSQIQVLNSVLKSQYIFCHCLLSDIVQQQYVFSVFCLCRLANKVKFDLMLL